MSRLSQIAYNKDMPTSRQLIRKIKIHRFRSFSDTEIDAEVLNIYSGKNNSGKSNILKALNLFFNGMTGYDTVYNHKTDYNIAYKGAAGGKREIKIEVFFVPSGKGALRHNFSVVKRFIEGQMIPIVEYRSEDESVQKEIENGNGNITRQFTAFLNKIEYLYIPAVRDKKFIKTLLLNFEQIINTEAKSRDFANSIDNLSRILADSSVKIGEGLKSYIGIDARASLSSNITDVLGATRIQIYPGTQFRQKPSKKRDNTIVETRIDLFSSGDGIVMSYLVYFLAYLTKKSNKNFIWGFEEPENSLEYSKVQRLAEEFSSRFVKDAQIFITTHSPAFINLKDKNNTKFYRVFQRPLTESERKSGILNRGITYVQTLEAIRHQMSLLDINEDAYSTLDNELNLAEQAVEIENKLKELEEEKKHAEALAKKYEQEIREQKGLSIISEGNNIQHIKQAMMAIEPDLVKKVNFIEDAEDKTGKDQLKSLYNSLRLLHLRKKIMIIFDCDAKNDCSKLKDIDNVIVYVIPKNEQNEKVGGGIENIYPERYIDAEDFIIDNHPTNMGHATIEYIKKKEFLKKIEEIGGTDPKVFDCFRQIINEIKKNI